MTRIMIMAGGTGGHVYPALAIADHLKKAGVELLWLGTREGIEAELVPKAELPIAYITIQGVRRTRLTQRLLSPFRLFRAVYQAYKIIREFKPDAVLGLGGYASGPGGVATWLQRIPLIIHEQNSIAGYTNRILSKFAKVSLQAFPDTFAQSVNALCVGNPVRADLTDFPDPPQRLAQEDHPLHLLILGGSLGALALNQLVPQAIALLDPTERPAIWHQTGKAHLAITQAAYDEQEIAGRLMPYIEDMAEAYRWADFVMCRAGALTIAELTAVGRGAILVPFPYAVDDHQTRNAEFLVQGQAGVVVQQRDLTPARLADQLRAVIHDRARVYRMACAAKALQIADSTERVVSHCMGSFSSP